MHFNHLTYIQQTKGKMQRNVSLVTIMWMCYNMSQAAGVFTSCPIELSPPSVVVRYGDSVSVNCSTSESLFDGIGWEASQGGKSLESVTHMAWTVEKLTEWTISPSCYISPSPESSYLQCFKHPKVVLYSKSCSFWGKSEWYSVWYYV